MARLLVERETIYQDEVDMIMDGMDAVDIIKIMEERDETYRENPFAKMEEACMKKREENAEKQAEKTSESEDVNANE